MKKPLLGFLIGSCAALVGCAQPLTDSEATAVTARDQPADLVIVNARIWTGDPDFPEAHSLAVRNDRFLFVGENPAARSHVGGKTEIVDAAGARILPGLIDAHVHLIQGGLQLSRLQLREAGSRAQLIDAVAARARRLHKDEWVLGGRWSTESWADPSQPAKEWIDSVTPDNPVFLQRMDGHCALVNSLALKIAGIDRQGPSDPPGGRIERDAATGEPTGILKEAAVDLVAKHVPPPTAEEHRRALQAAMREANGHGLTTVHTMSAWDELAVLDAVRDAGGLTLRVRFYVSEDDWNAYLDRAGSHRDDAWVLVCGFKQFADGSLGSRTAYMSRPFDDNPADKADWRGLPGAVMEEEGKLEQMCQAVDAAGFGAAVHAIGDQANHVVLDIYESVEKTNGARSQRRLRIEHAQHLLPEDIARFASLGVIASMQPLHKADDARYAEKAIGAERCRTSYAFRSLVDSGAHLAFGSDWPVVTLNPFKGVHAAVTGKTLDGKTFVPEQNLSVEEALTAYTLGGAYAAGDEKDLGQIRRGCLADFVIMADDPLKASAEDLGSVRVRGTYVGGRRVWPLNPE